MKILLLNPRFDALQGVAPALKKMGIAPILATSAEDAIRMLQLHGGTVKAVVVAEPLAGPLNQQLVGLTEFAALQTFPLMESAVWSAVEIQGLVQGANSQSLGAGMPTAETSRPDGSSAQWLVPPSGIGLEVISEEAPSQEVPSGISVSKIFKAQDLAVEPSASQDVPDSAAPDREAMEQMPYLYPQQKIHRGTLTPYAQPLDDSVVPGGAAQSPDEETLKKYLLYREQDVAALSAQVRTVKSKVEELEAQLSEARVTITEVTHQAEDRQKKITELEAAVENATKNAESEKEELRFQIRARADKARHLEVQVKEALEQIETIKERVRVDIRRIRFREKELENRLEIMKKDSEALVAARENKIIELKRKVDLLEFNLDLAHEQNARAKEENDLLRERIGKVAQAVRVAGGILDPATQGRGDRSGERTGGDTPDVKKAS